MGGGWTRTVGGLTALWLGGLAGLNGAAGGESAEVTGERLLKAQCAGCHAIGRAGASPLTAAPPFRTLHRKYPVSHLAEALAEGITTGHNNMPEFVFSTEEIAAILAYLESIADGPASKP